jgi:catechol 2,3-dioxygenase-like lactoylglutathione lyase family enzyme
MTDNDPPRLLQVTIDCADPDRLAGFWPALLGVEVRGRQHQFVHLAAQPGRGVGLAFQQVPEPRAAKNRVHLDFLVDDLEAAVSRAVELGATKLELHTMDGHHWWVVADPDGNQLCLIQPAAG